MFHETKDARATQASVPRPTSEARRPTRRRRIMPLLIGAALVFTLVAFGIGVTAQSRAEARIAELDEQLRSLELELGERLAAVDEVTQRVDHSRAENDDARSALVSTEGFLE